MQGALGQHQVQVWNPSIQTQVLPSPRFAAVSIPCLKDLVLLGAVEDIFSRCPPGSLPGEHASVVNLYTVVVGTILLLHS